MQPCSYNKICCGVVLYNPETNMLEKNLDALSLQFNEIVLIDNCSINIKEVYELIKKYNIRINVINNDRNMGVAYALNQILGYAANRGYEWFLTMDQDSIVSHNLVNEYSHYLDDSSLGILSPYILNNDKTNIGEYKSIQLDDVEIVKDPIYCITSGALNRVQYALEINGYTDEMFIDGVDVDFNIRMMAAGHKIVRVNTTYLVQKMGVGKRIAFFDLLYNITHIYKIKRLSVTPIYPDIRLYYIFRNSKYLFDRYGSNAGKRMSTMWMVGQAIYYCLTYPINRSRVSMFKAILKGRRDGKKLGEL